MSAIPPPASTDPPADPPTNRVADGPSADPSTRRPTNSPTDPSTGASTELPPAGPPAGSSADGPGDDRGADIPEWDDLPPAARTAAVALAAGVLGRVPADRLPALVRPVAAFTASKRARRGARPLSRALAGDAAFRALIAEQLARDADRTPDPPTGTAAAATPAAVADTAPTDTSLTDTSPTDTALADTALPETALADAAGRLARAFIQRVPVPAAVRTDVDLAARAEALQARVDDLTATVESLTARIASSRTTNEPDGRGRHHGVPAVTALRGENEKLRQRLREQGTRRRDAETAAEDAMTQARKQVAAATSALERATADAAAWKARSDLWQQRVRALEQALDRQRQQRSQARADTDRRIELLLDTVAQAAAGLRREWHLAGGGDDPATVVVRDFAAPETATGRSADAPLLTEWLRLPQAHLIIDGYNVTKTGYPHLTLAEQRDRLIRSLGSLAARTGAEVTVVFDGADVVAPPVSNPRVRVVFSPPGVIADDVVRSLAGAEPDGRVVIVVSTDKEVVAGARRVRARTAPSAVLLDVLR